MAIPHMATKARAFQHACRARLTDSVPYQNPLCTLPTRTYATQTNSPGATKTTATGVKRRAITVTSDDGRYNWSELSTGEKAARTTQQSFNFVFVGAGALGTVRLGQTYVTRPLLNMTGYRSISAIHWTVRRRFQNSSIQSRCWQSQEWS